MQVYFNLTVALAISLLTSVNVSASQSLDNMSQKLIQLRGEVEELNNEIRFLKEEHKQEMNFLWTQQNQVKTELSQNQKLVERLEKELQETKEENQAKGRSSEELMPEFKSAVEKVNAYLEGSLPFKKAERKASLAEIETQVSKELISVQRGFNKLWAFVEDEIRLTKESGLYQSSILVEGDDRKQLVDIARIGMMTVYFKTKEDQYGKLAHSANGWSYQLLKKDSDIEQVGYLFDSLKKQIRTGLFTLPMNTDQ